MKLNENKFASKTLHYQIWAADISSKLGLKFPCEKNWVVTFNATKIKLVTFHHH